MVLIGGIKLRSRLHITAAMGYFLLAAYFFIGAQFTASRHGPLPDVALFTAFFIMWLGGIAHVVVLQMQMRGQVALASAFASVAADSDPALLAAQWRYHRRQEARAILARYPALAVELRIGRPDLPGRQYNDGGLLDVNHVPAGLLVSELEIPADVAATIVSQRDRFGGFSSPDELVVYCTGVMSERLQIIREKLVFVAL
jgi:hypothetical protein